MSVKFVASLIFVASLLAVMTLTLGVHSTHAVAQHIIHAGLILPQCGEIGGPPCIH
jgi:hypothetical protein